MVRLVDRAHAAAPDPGGNDVSAKRGPRCELQHDGTTILAPTSLTHVSAGAQSRTAAVPCCAPGAAEGTSSGRAYGSRHVSQGSYYVPHDWRSPGAKRNDGRDPSGLPARVALVEQAQELPGLDVRVAPVSLFVGVGGIDAQPLQPRPHHQRQIAQTIPIRRAIPELKRQIQILQRPLVTIR